MNTPPNPSPRFFAHFASPAALALAVALTLGVAGTGCSRLKEFDPEAARRRESLDLVAQAEAMESAGQYEAARREYARAHEIAPRPAALLGMARCLKAEGRHAEAEQCLEEALRESPEAVEAKLLRQRVENGKKSVLLQNLEKMEAADSKGDGPSAPPARPVSRTQAKRSAPANKPAAASNKPPQSSNKPTASPGKSSGKSSGQSAKPTSSSKAAAKRAPADKPTASAAKASNSQPARSAPVAAPVALPVIPPSADSGRRVLAQADPTNAARLQANQGVLDLAEDIGEGTETEDMRSQASPDGGIAQEIIPDALAGVGRTQGLEGAGEDLGDFGRGLSDLEISERPQTEEPRAGAPPFRRMDSLEARRWRNRVDEFGEVSERDLRFALEALAEVDPDAGRKTIAQYREELEAAKDAEPLELPSDDLIDLAFFSVGTPRPDPGIPSDRLAGDARYYVDRGQALAGEGKLEQARLAFLEAIERDPRDPVARVELGYVFERLGQRDLALQQHQAAIKLAPRMARAHYRLGNAHLAHGFIDRDQAGYERAIEAYDIALEIDPNNLFSLHNKGAALLELGRWQEAQAAFEEVRDLDSTYNPVYRNLGIIAERHESNKLKALDYYQKYLALGGKDTVSVSAWIRQIESDLAGL